MKYLKYYERNKKESTPQNGDYVIVDFDDLENVFKNQVGILNYSYNDDDDDLIYVIEFNDNGKPILIDSFLSDIKYWTKNKKDAEIYLKTKQYNL